MSDSVNYFLIKGGIIKERLGNFFATRKLQLQARLEFSSSLGATASLPLFDYQDLQYAVLGKEDHFRFMQGMTIRFLSYEQIGEMEVLIVPKIEERTEDRSSIEATTNWVPPDEGCVPLKNSEYWALKEALESLNSQSEALN